jgi:hydrogenase maturation protease
MKTLIFGAGNLLLSDEGFGVHFVRYLEAHYHFPPEVELLDAGTMGIMVTHKIEEADRVFLVDIVETQGDPGQFLRYCKDDFMLKRIPIKMSPHQIGVQEMLLISELRGCAPSEVYLWGVIPSSLESGCELTPVLQKVLVKLADQLVKELRVLGESVTPRVQFA